MQVLFVSLPISGHYHVLCAPVVHELRLKVTSHPMILSFVLSRALDDFSSRSLCELPFVRMVFSCNRVQLLRISNRDRCTRMFVYPNECLNTYTDLNQMRTHDLVTQFGDS
jgi:hypothetical protein